MKRVLILSQTSVFGGAEVVLTDFLKENTSHDFLIFTSSDNSIIGKYKELLPNAKIITSSTMRFYSMREHPLKAIYELLIRLKKVNQIVKEHKIDILYGNNTADLITVVLYKKLYNRQIKIISHIHDMLDLPVYRKYLRFIRRFDNIVDAYIVPSSAGKKAFAEFVHDENKIHVIHNGVSCEHEKTLLTKEQLKEKYGIPVEKRVMLFVGLISKIKRLDLFVNVIDALNEIVDEYVGVVIGKLADDSFSNFIYHKNIVYLGQRERETLFKEIYNMAECLIVTSDSENLSTVSLEAMSAGLFVAARDVGGTSEYIDDDNTGILLPVNATPDMIAKKIYYIVNNDAKRNAIIEKANEMIKNEFDNNHKCDLINQLIENLGKTE